MASSMKILIGICFLISIMKSAFSRVCHEGKIFRELLKDPLRAQEVNGRDPPSTWRSLLKSLDGCTVYVGNLVICDSAARKSKYEENVRPQDFFNLRNIEQIFGDVRLDLEKYPEMKNLSFLTNLRAIYGIGDSEFALVNSQVEMLDLMNLTMNVTNVTIVNNKQLCYFERFETLWTSISITIRDNKDPKMCDREGKVCSKACSPKKGCWGPSSSHCFQCRWRAGDDCVEACEAKSGFFTPRTGRVCGRCHVDCGKDCPQHCKVCREDDLLKNLWRKKPLYKIELDSLGGLSWTPRFVLEALINCTVYHGNIKVKKMSAVNNGFEEYVRVKDFNNLKNLQEIYGYVYLDMEKYSTIQTLSFLSNLRKIETQNTRGFTLLRSYVEMIGFINIRLNVPFIGIGHNSRLCYLDHIKINSSIKYTKVKNKSQNDCRDEGKVCSGSCNSTKGCWGPSSRHCFECRHWKAGEECVESCNSRIEFFTPPRGRVCGRCHESCRYGCFGRNEKQCYYSIVHCPPHMYYNKSKRQCEECSPLCFGNGYKNRRLLSFRACSGPGRRGCSLVCPAKTSVNVTLRGQFVCHGAELERLLMKCDKATPKIWFLDVFVWGLFLGVMLGQLVQRIETTTRVTTVVLKILRSIRRT